MLRCEECWCVSESGTGWYGYISEDPEVGAKPLVVAYCPPCAARRLEAQPREREYV